MIYYVHKDVQFIEVPMSTLSATDARKFFFDLIKGAGEHHKTYHIQHRKGDVVLLSEADYESLLETLELLSIPDFRKRIKKSVKQVKKGETLSMKDVFGE